MTQTEKRPPLIVALGTAPALGWLLYILLDVAHVDDEVRLWILFPAMLPILMLAEFISKKLKPNAAWIVGISGLVTAFAAIWIYQLLRIQ